MRAVAKIVLFLAAALIPSSLAAHPVPFSYLDIRFQPTALDVTLTIHIFDLAHDLQVTPMERLLDSAFLATKQSAIQTMLTPRLQLAADGHALDPVWKQSEVVEEQQSIRFHLQYAVSAAPGMISISTVMFPYDSNHQTFINIYENRPTPVQRIVNVNHPSTEYFSGTREGVWAVIQKFVPAGIHHILIGPDHLLFLVGLLLLGGSIRRLAVVVTSFTIAHSVTLSLAALNILTPPARLIEPAIALSIIYVGADNLLAQGGRDVRAWIAFAFGFIHGFGFANVLREMDLPTAALGWSLFSFNFGVEIGQLLVVISVATAFAALRSRSEWAKRQLVFAGSIVVIAAGTFWFIQRVFFPV
jgi:hydrogenase/urease accessory protein HupE